MTDEEIGAGAEALSKKMMAMAEETLRDLDDVDSCAVFLAASIGLAVCSAFALHDGDADKAVQTIGAAAQSIIDDIMQGGS